MSNSDDTTEDFDLESVQVVMREALQACTEANAALESTYQENQALRARLASIEQVLGTTSPVDFVQAHEREYDQCREQVLGVLLTQQPISAKADAVLEVVGSYIEAIRATQGMRFDLALRQMGENPGPNQQ